MEGGSFRLFDVNSTGQTGPFTNTIEVPEGKTAYWYLPKRWIFTNKITGNGTLFINAPYIRSDFNNDWSGFSGTLHFTGRDIRLNSLSARNITNAGVVFDEGTTLYAAKNGSGEATDPYTFTSGTLNNRGALLLHANQAGNDKIVVKGTASLNGSLSVSSSTLFPLNKEIDLFDVSGAVSGQFAAVNLPSIVAGGVWNTDSLYTSGKIKVVSSTAIPALFTDKEMTISPNPAKEYITIYFEKPGAIPIQIIDISGKVIAGRTVTSREKIHTGALPEGIYLIRRSDGTGGNIRFIKKKW
jgi:hypothetical protein